MKKVRKKTNIIKIVLMTILIFIVIAAAALCGLAYLVFNPPMDSKKINNSTVSSGESSFFGEVPDKTVFAFYFVDKSRIRTDVTIIGGFDKSDKSINAVYVPRETIIELPEDKADTTEVDGENLPQEVILKEFLEYAGENGVEYLTEELGKMLDVNIDYYFIIQLDALSELIDAIGGIEFDVPFRIYEHDDERELYVDIMPGLQILNGEQVLGLLRYSSYDTGGFERTDMQITFLKVFMRHTFTESGFVDLLTKLLPVFLDNVETNMRIGDALKYAQFLKSSGFNSFNAEKLEGEIIDECFYPDAEKTAELSEKYFK